MKPLRLLLLLSGMLWLGAAQPAMSQQLIAGRFEHSGDERAYAGGMSLDAAVAQVQNRYDAKAVKTETVNENGRRVYYIRLLNREGRVWTVKVDAESGRIS